MHGDCSFSDNLHAVVDLFARVDDQVISGTVFCRVFNMHIDPARLHIITQTFVGMLSTATEYLLSSII